MVFENLTLIEVHVEDSQVGPKQFGTGEKSPGEQTEVQQDAREAAEPSESNTVLKLVVASVVISIVGALVARKWLGGRDSEGERSSADTSNELPTEE